MNDNDQQRYVLGIVGFINSGKDTAADFLCNTYGFRRDSFANTLKDSISIIFGWNRTLLEGRTKESREWRNHVDTWWAERLNIPHLTPRWVLQNWGTEVCRNNFHNDIWIASLENKLRKSHDNVVITDVRFQNEIQAIHNAGGKIIRIKRGPDPEWFNDARIYNLGPKSIGWVMAKDKIKKLRIHESEYSWIGGNIDYEVDNNTTIDNLFEQIKKIVQIPEYVEP